VAVRIRMKKLGRKHRPFYRICAVDGRAPRDGRVLEEVGTYDPMIPETDARAELNHERVAYWLGVGAQMSNKVQVLMKKYGPEGTHLQAREAALAKLAVPRAIPDPGEPAYTPEPPKAEPPKAEEPQVAKPAEDKAAEAVAETTDVGSEDTSDSPAEPSAEAAPEEVVADQAAAEEAQADAEEKSE